MPTWYPDEETARTAKRWQDRPFKGCGTTGRWLPGHELRVCGICPNRYQWGRVCRECGNPTREMGK